jgi:protein ImuB
MPPVSQKTWIALWLPRLSIERLIRLGAAPADVPFATTRKDGNRVALAAVNVPARKAGLEPGLALADARARIPTLAVRMAEDEADLKLLDHIAGWCERFSPIVALDPPQGLFLDITGCAHLFGDAAQMRAGLVNRLAAQGFSARAAIAHTPGAAWALSRFERGAKSCLDAALGPTLESLPIKALRLSPEAEDLLARLGLTTIRHLIAAPRAGFAARVGQHALLRLDQAFGRASETITPRRPAPPVFADRRFMEPLVHEDAILIGAEHAALDVSAELENRGAGAMRFALDLFPVSGAAKRVVIGLSRADRDAARLVRLLREKFTALTAPLCDEFGIEALRLSAFELRNLNERAENWIDGKTGGATLAALSDAISARLGASAALRPVIQAEHLPEKAGALLTADKPSAPTPNNQRPLRLFSSPQPIEAIAAVPDGAPERFRWRRVLRRIVRAEGPERITLPWFSADAGPTRDYFRVEDDQGRRYWLYREGLYDEVEHPRWFMHGLFA